MLMIAYDGCSFVLQELAEPCTLLSCARTDRHGALPIVMLRALQGLAPLTDCCSLSGLHCSDMPS